MVAGMGYEAVVRYFLCSTLLSSPMMEGVSEQTMRSCAKGARGRRNKHASSDENGRRDRRNCTPVTLLPSRWDGPPVNHRRSRTEEEEEASLSLSLLSTVASLLLRLRLRRRLPSSSSKQKEREREADRKRKGMDDYAREMMELKTLVTRTLEKKGVLAKIRAELRASVFEAIEEEDRVVENDDGGNPALLGSCNDRAKQLHASPSGRLLTALPKDFWKNELKDFSNKSGAEGSRSAESGPMLLDVLEGYLKYEDEYNWRYDADDISEEVLRASSALENVQLDRKARNLTTSWRHPGEGAE
uniref:LisH domain-containing protein n=1 Tax=Oryza punctata TaxID=4537 RepID=A0A0E0MIL1_ORYPU